MKRYLHLKFIDATVNIRNKTDKRGTVVVNELGVYKLVPPAETAYENPIGVSQVSNMLHVMLSCVPKPTYRKSIIPRIDRIYEIAKNARIKYYDNCDKHINEIAEFNQTAKAAWNSNAMIKTILDGKEHNGFYRWNYLLRLFEGFESEKEELLNFFAEVLGVDDVIQSYTFAEFVKEFRKHVDEERVIDFYENWLEEDTGEVNGKGRSIKNKNLLGSPFIYAIFGKCPDGDGKGSNTNVTTKEGLERQTPLVYSHGTATKKAKLSGEIIIPFDDDEIYQQLIENGRIPTILDGGVVEVLGCKNFEPYPTYKSDFSEIFEQKTITSD